jgi:hypothetical protein
MSTRATDMSTRATDMSTRATDMSTRATDMSTRATDMSASSYWYERESSAADVYTRIKSRLSVAAYAECEQRKQYQ